MLSFKAVLNELKLTSQDRAKLKKDRGFSSETIKHFQLKSPASPGEAASMVSKLGLDTLRRDRLVHNTSLIPALTNTGVIPFFLEDGTKRKCVRLKGHKYGLKGVDPMVFRATRDDVKTLYICESEYKAMAMWQMGYSAIGLSGITVFATKHYGILLDTIMSIKPAQCVIVFDNDDKSSPDSKKFTANSSDRYESFKFQWLIAHQLEKDKVETYIANLPDNWRINGGCDIDGCLAAGKTREDFDKHISLEIALTPQQFKDSWVGTGEMDEILTQWASARLAKPLTRPVSNCLFSPNKKGDVVKITNFDMYISSVHIDDDTQLITSRFVEVINEFGTKFAEVEITNAQLSNSGRFSQWCLGHPGNIVFFGMQTDMPNISTYLNTVSTPMIVRHTTTMGWNEKYKAYLFGDGAYQFGARTDSVDGKMFLEGDTVKVDSPFSDGDPPFSVDISTQEFDWRDAIERMVDNYGDGQVRIVVTWCLASMLTHVFEETVKPKLFPLLWITGAMGAGKNTLLSQCLSFIGVHEFEGIAINQVTEASLWRLLAHFSSMPVWIDELRKDKECEVFDGVWRSIYNRTCTSKSKMNDDRAIITNKVRGTVCLTGQDISGDTALNQRLIPVEVSESTRNGNNYEWICQNNNAFSYAAHEMLTSYDEVVACIKENYKSEKDKWKVHVNNDRIAANIAVVSVTAKALNIDLGKDFCMKRWAGKVAREIEEGSDDRDFLDGICPILRDDPAMIGRVFANVRDDENIFMCYNQLYAMWRKNMTAQGENVMSSKAIKGEMISHGIMIKEMTGKVLDASNRKVSARGIVLKKDMLSEHLLSTIRLEMTFRDNITKGSFIA